MGRTFLKTCCRRWVGLLLAIVFCAACAVVPTRAASGLCGEQIAWEYAAGTLVISGTGEMDHFSEPEMAPWYAYRKEV